MKKMILASGVALGLLAPSAQAQTTLITSLWSPPHHPITEAVEGWCDDVATATEKRVRCNILPKAVAGPAGAFDAVRAGVADVSFSVHGYMPGRFTLTQVAEFPFSGDTGEAISVAYQRVYARYLEPLDEHRGLKVLSVFTHGPGNIYNSKMAVNSVEDMQQLKWRIGGGLLNDVSDALGISAALKPATEVYPLLSMGVIDGVFFTATSVGSHALEIVTHGTNFPGGIFNLSFALVMNPSVWEGIPEKDRKIIEQLSGERLAARFGRAWDKRDGEILEKMKARGIALTKASPEFVQQIEQRLVPVEQAWIDRAKERGLADPAKVLREFREAAMSPQ